MILPRLVLFRAAPREQHDDEAAGLGLAQQQLLCDALAQVGGRRAPLDRDGLVGALPIEVHAQDEALRRHFPARYI